MKAIFWTSSGSLGGNLWRGSLTTLGKDSEVLLHYVRGLAEIFGESSGHLRGTSKANVRCDLWGRSGGDSDVLLRYVTHLLGIFGASSLTAHEMPGFDAML